MQSDISDEQQAIWDDQWAQEAEQIEAERRANQKTVKSMSKPLAVGDSVSFTSNLGLINTGVVLKIVDGVAAVGVDVPVVSFPLHDLTPISNPVRNAIGSAPINSAPQPPAFFPAVVATPAQAAALETLNAPVETVATGHGVAEQTSAVEGTPAAAVK